MKATALKNGWTCDINGRRIHPDWSHNDAKWQVGQV